MALLAWQNLIFLLPMLAALGYVFLMAAGLGFGEHDLDVDHDIGLDVGHDVDAGADHDLDTDHDVHAGHHVSGGHLLGTVLGALGVGKVPLSILMLSACFIWGAVGLALNVVLGTDGMLRVVGFSALASLVGTRLLAEGLAGLMPREETYYTRKDEMIGLAGDVLYEVTPTAGTVRLLDPTGNLLDLDCRTRGGPIKAGTRAVLDEYDPAADVFIVRVCNEGAVNTEGQGYDPSGEDSQ